MSVKAHTEQRVKAGGSMASGHRTQGWGLRAAGLLLAGGLLAGCADAWETVTRPIDPLPPAEPETISESAQEGAGEYPNLSEVPDRPPRQPSGKAERDQIRDSLAADRENARYTGDTRTGEGVGRTDDREGATDDAQSATDDGQPASVPEVPDRPDFSSDAASAGEGGAASDGAGGTSRMADAGTETGDRARDGDTTQQATAGDAAADTDAPSDRSDGTQSATAGDTRQDAPDTASQSGAQRAGSQPPAVDVPQMQPSQRGEPVRLPGETASSAAGDTRQQAGQGDSRPRRQQTARRDGAAQQPPADARSRTLGPGEPGGRTNAAGGRRAAVVYFAHGTSSLTAQDRRVLRRIAEIYERRQIQLRVVGHASSRTAAMDPIDHRMANFEMSLDRAQAVADALARMGVERADIQVEARGDRDPVYHEFMPTGEAGNRRAEVFVQG
jgi:outer membrane protein OmpA-like peptidoglycan-associated protein